ncbi:MAG: XdhC family protein [Acidobacteria bacterium]|nr:XdhC family protein [Acidobacteriota bacterium]
MALLTLAEVYDEIARAQSSGHKLAIANIVTTAGSTPQGKGAKLVVHEDGRMQGTVGGGCVEADVWAEAKEALYENAARLCFFTLRDNPDVPPDEEGMVCGGEMEVFIEVWSPTFQPVLTAAATAEHLRQAESNGETLALVSLLTRDKQALPHTPHLIVNAQGAIVAGSLNDQALNEFAAREAVALIADERAELVVSAAQDMRLLFEIARPALQLVICGGGHVGQAVAKAARLLDFNVMVIDDRAEFAARDKFPDPAIKLLAMDFIEALRSLRITQATHVVIVTRGHRHDELCLQEVIDKPARYLGMIGSRRRTTTIRERLKREGVVPASLQRVHAPIGLDIGAQTPEEIAFAIMSEIILVRRGGTGVPKSAEGPMAKAR